MQTNKLKNQLNRRRRWLKSVGSKLVQGEDRKERVAFRKLCRWQRSLKKPSIRGEPVARNSWALLPLRRNVAVWPASAGCRTPPALSWHYLDGRWQLLFLRFLRIPRLDDSLTAFSSASWKDLQPSGVLLQTSEDEKFGGEHDNDNWVWNSKAGMLVIAYCPLSRCWTSHQKEAGWFLLGSARSDAKRPGSHRWPDMLQYLLNLVEWPIEMSH